MRSIVAILLLLLTSGCGGLKGSVTSTDSGIIPRPPVWSATKQNEIADARSLKCNPSADEATRILCQQSDELGTLRLANRCAILRAEKKPMPEDCPTTP
jgi:hypothetical protein